MGLCLPDGRWAHHRDRGWVCLVRPDGILSWGIEMSEERGRGGGGAGRNISDRDTGGRWARGWVILTNGPCRLIGDWHRWYGVGSNSSSAGLGLGKGLPSYQS